jgi:hypothetical protein
MTLPSAITVRIGRLVLRGVTPAEGHRLAHDLRTSLAAAIAADPAAVAAAGSGLTQHRLSLHIPVTPASGLGVASGRAVAQALRSGPPATGDR